MNMDSHEPDFLDGQEDARGSSLPQPGVNPFLLSKHGPRSCPFFPCHRRWNSQKPSVVKSRTRSGSRKFDCDGSWLECSRN